MNLILLDGMTGIPIPYLLRSDGMVTGILFLCILLVSFVLSRGKKVLFQGLRDFVWKGERSSISNEVTASDARHTILLLFHSTIRQHPPLDVVRNSCAEHQPFPSPKMALLQIRELDILSKRKKQALGICICQAIHLVRHLIASAISVRCLFRRSSANGSSWHSGFANFS